MFLVLLLACREDTPSTSAPDTAADTDLDPTDDTATDTDTDTDTAVPPVDSICVSEGGTAETPALWSVDGRTLSIVTLDGTVTEVHSFFADLGDDDAYYTPRVKGRGAVVVGAMDRYEAGVPARVTEELVYVGPGGTWSVTEPEVYGGEVFLGADGSVAWDRGYRNFDAANEHLTGHLYTADGTRRELLGWAIGAPVGGAVPVCSETACGWDKGSGTLLEERAQSEWARMVADRLVYPTAAGLVSEVPGDVRMLPLGSVGGALALDAWEGDWLLVNDGENRWRVDVAAGTAALLDVPLPLDQRPFDGDGFCGTRNPFIDDQGNVLMPLRDDASAAFWRLDRSRAWSRLGATVSDVVFLAGRGRGGTYLLEATGTSDTFCPPLAWDEPAPEALVGTSLQLVRPDDPAAAAVIATLTDISAGQLSPAGRCVLVRAKATGVVIDLSTGAQSVLVGVRGWVEGG